VERLRGRFPNLAVAGTYAPPFRPLSREEDERVIQLINGAKPDLVWVGLSTPKQERWMAEHVVQLEAPVLLGVGAAFDIHARPSPRPSRAGAASSPQRPEFHSIRISARSDASGETLHCRGMAVQRLQDCRSGHRPLAAPRRPPIQLGRVSDSVLRSWRRVG